MVDASQFGAVIQQSSDNGWQPLDYFSRKRKGIVVQIYVEPIHTNCSLYIWVSSSSVKFLEGRTFAISTRHKPFTRFNKIWKRPASPRQLMHLDFVGQLSTDIRHVPGEENIIADTLSRMETI